MKKALRWLGIGAGTLAGVVLLAVAAVYGVSRSRMAEHYDVPVAAIEIPTDSAAVAHGRHMTRAIAKCGACHGNNYEGQVFFEDPLFGRGYAPNITPAGIVADYTDQDWVRALRHGLKPDGRSLQVMPSYEFYHLSDEDLGAVIAYMKSLPPVQSGDGSPRRGPLYHLLVAGDLFPILPARVIDHNAPRPEAPAVAPSPEYGRYIAEIGCVSCHGPTLQGAKPPATGPDITQFGRTAGWTEADFRLALRAGKRPDGTVIDPEMPWNLTTEMTDVEIAAVWAYVQSLGAPARTAQGPAAAGAR
jgi:mono/diheme cytochrome c family protein